MNSARFVHDTLELAGWNVDIADAQNVKGLAPLACKTDRIDAWVLAELSRRIWSRRSGCHHPTFGAHRERAWFRLHLVHHRVELKNRIHSALIAFGHARPTSDLFGTTGRARLAELEFPEPWASDVAAAVELIDHINVQIAWPRARPAWRGRRPPVRAAVDDHPRDQLGAGVHDRRGNRRHRPLRVTQEARRLQRPVPTGRAVRRQGPPGPSPATAQSTSVGRSSKPPRTPLAAKSTATTTNGPRPASAASATPRSPASRSPARSAKRSGKRSPRGSPSLRRSHETLWPHPTAPI
jgi:hypothetical protein